MATVSQLMQQLRRSALRQDGAGLTDGQLLECYIESRDDAAFAALVHRHASMVWGVCRRLLDHHDAEDALQASFLVLCRKAASVQPREMLANWLYGVAHQTALQARRTAARRRARELQVTPMPNTAHEPARWDDLQLLLDRELSCLSDKYRIVIILCDLEGKTRKQAARELRLPIGTVASRLARARRMLAQRLARHGVALSGGALAIVLAQHSAAAAVPTSALFASIEAASLLAAGKASAAGVVSAQVAALVEGVTKAMLLSKLKLIATTAVLLAVVLVAGPAAWTSYGHSADPPPLVRAVTENVGAKAQPMPPADAPARKRIDDPALAAHWHAAFLQVLAQKPERDKWQGKWEVELAEVHNNPDYKNTCVLCHQQIRQRGAHIDRLIEQKYGEIVPGTSIDRLIVKKYGEVALVPLAAQEARVGDAEFLRRICLDILGRLPTPLEMHYYLKDSDPDKNRKTIESLVQQAGAPYAVVQLGPAGAPLSAAEKYVQEQLGEKLTQAQRRLIQKVLDFVGKERGPDVDRAAVNRLWQHFFSLPATGEAEPRRETALAARQLGDTHEQQGKLAEAEEAYRKALAVQEKLVQEFPAARAYRHDLAGTCSRLGALYRRTGRLADAERMLRQALVHLERLSAEAPEPTRP